MLRPLLNLSMSYLFVFFSLLPLEKHKKKTNNWQINGYYGIHCG